MPVFNIDHEEIVNRVAEDLEQAGAQMSQEKFNQIAGKINDALPGIIQIIAEKTAEFWQAEAEATGGWGSKYAKAIRYKVQGSSAQVFLDEKMKDKESNKPNFMFAMMVEKGVKSWSIKDALLRSKKAKVGKDGVRYIIIPFPVSAPRKKGSGKSKAQFGGREMTQEMYDVVKSGGKLSSGKIKGKDVSGLSKYNTRQLHGQYGIFRCVSSKSTGWQYPNVPAEPVYANVLKEVNNQIQNAVAAFCEAVVKELGK